MPRLGGLAIFIAFIIGLSCFSTNSTRGESQLMPLAIVFGATVIIITGVLDDMYEISAKAKMLGQLVAAFIIVFLGGIQIDLINLPFGGELDLGF